MQACRSAVVNAVVALTYTSSVKYHNSACFCQFLNRSEHKHATHYIFLLYMWMDCTHIIITCMEMHACTSQHNLQLCAVVMQWHRRMQQSCMHDCRSAVVATVLPKMKKKLRNYDFRGALFTRKKIPFHLRASSFKSVILPQNSWELPQISLKSDALKREPPVQCK